MTADVPGDGRYPEQAQMWLALTRLEKQVQTQLPDLFDSTVRSKDKLFTLLSRPLQETVTGQIEADNKPTASFDSQVEAAEKISDVGRRDHPHALLRHAESRGHVRDAVDRSEVVSIASRLAHALNPRRGSVRRSWCAMGCRSVSGLAAAGLFRRG